MKGNDNYTSNINNRVLYYMVTPIIFVTNLIGAMKAIKEGKETKSYTIACCISLMMIIIPIFSALIYR